MERYRIHEDASVYFITYSVVEWLPIFVSEEPCMIVTDSLTYCHEHLGLRVNAYVIMPTHLHAIVFHRDYDPSRLVNALNAFRKHTGRTLADFTADKLPELYSTAMNRAAGKDRKRRFWQPTRHPESISDQRFWRQKFSYLHNNPCRKGLVRYPEEWRFSSARFYNPDASDTHCEIPVALIDW